MIARRLGWLSACAVALAGCSSLQSLNPFDDSPKLKALTPITTSAANARWQVQVGAPAPGLRAAAIGDMVYAVNADGILLGVNAKTGAQSLRVTLNEKISAGVGSDGALLVVGTEKGKVIALGMNGERKWTAQVSSVVLSPPLISDGLVIVNAGDGALTGLDSLNGNVKWTQRRTLPSLTVRNHAGMVSSRRAGFLGTPGGRLLAFDTVTGTQGWEAVVATPRGTTELDRIADIVSTPKLDERVACVTTYQGRTGCFELTRGTTVWVRDISSRYGLLMDDDHVYVSDEKFVVHALDKSTGATVWKQDALIGRRIGWPQLINGKLALFDPEGYVHVLDAKAGTLLGRSTANFPLPNESAAIADGALVWLSTKGALQSLALR